jgi:acyl carrier protein
MSTNITKNQAVDAAAVRQIVAQQGCLPIDVSSLADDSDLYTAGLTSLATVGLMLALEDRFDIEFPERMLGRATFRSLASITEAVSELIA